MNSLETTGTLQQAIPKVLWYVKRLRVMDTSEMILRVRDFWKIRMLQLQYRFNCISALPLRDLDPDRFAFCQSRNACLPDLEWDFEEVYSYKEDLLRGKCLGLAPLWRWTPERVSWHLAPDTNKPWPQVFFDHISFRPGNSTGDARVMWEPGRLQHFVALGILVKKGDAQLSKQALSLIEQQLISWVEENPFPTGIHYVSAMESGLRVLSLCHAFDLIRSSLAHPQALWRIFLQVIISHGAWIAQNISCCSSRGNHTVVEATALLYLGILFPELSESTEWERFGRQLLEEEAFHLIADDGGGTEQAFGYQALVLDCFALADQLLDRSAKPFSPMVKERLGRGAEFLRACWGSFDREAIVGDYDDGHVVSPFLRLAQGDTSASKFSEGLQCFSSSGYSVLHSHHPLPCVLLMDHGSLGLAPCFGHGHADALSLIFRCGKRNVLIDPGTYSYWDLATWRRYFRGTSAHNTVTMNSLDQAVQEGAFLWSAPYESRARQSEQSTDGRVRILAFHDGYQKRLGAIHWRGILFYPPHTWVIWDRLNGAGSNCLELNWHCGVTPQHDASTWSFPIDNEVLRMEIYGGLTSVYRGETHPMAGWHSTRYGQREKISTLRTTFHGPLPHEFVTCLTFAASFPSQADMVNDLTSFRESVNDLPAN